MRILMFGRGVISTIYGHALQDAGHDVEFYVRLGRAAEYGDEVRLDLIDGRRTPLGKQFGLQVPTRLRETIEPRDDFDLIILSVAHHRLADAAEFLAPRVGNATVLVFGNVWDEPLVVTRPIPAEQLVFGFPLAGGGFANDNVLHGALFRSVIVSEAGSSPNLREIAVRRAFKQAGFTIRQQSDMRGWLWLHFIADVGMHVQGHRFGGLKGMIGNRQAFREALLTSRELLPVLEARGIDLSKHRQTTLSYRLSTPTAAAMAWATARFPIARVSLAAHADPYAAEPSAVLRDALLEARRLGIPTPRLASVEDRL